jgi:tRNA G18 (ribose-2'-O)-methylase SpoU
MEEPTLRNIKYNVHNCFQNKDPDEMKNIASKLAIPVHLVLVNLDGNMNIAMSIRTAAVLGCSDVWIIGRRRYDARPEVGSRHYINVHKLDNIENPYEFFKSKGIQPILVEQGGVPLEEVSFRSYLHTPVCFIMGSESNGISKEWEVDLRKAPRISISQYGMIRSLNVSIAASIVLYEYLSQWRNYRKDV